MELEDRKDRKQEFKKYSRRLGEFHMQVIVYKVWLLSRYKYTMEFQKILLSLFRAWSVTQKPPMRAENFFA